MRVLSKMSLYNLVLIKLLILFCYIINIHADKTGTELSVKEDFSYDPAAQHLVQEQRVLAILRYTRETLSKECNNNIGGGYSLHSSRDKSVMEGTTNKRNNSQFNPSATTATATASTSLSTRDPIILTGTNNINQRQVQQRTDVGQSYTQTFHPPPANHSRNIPTTDNATSNHNSTLNIPSSNDRISKPTHTNTFNTISDNIWGDEFSYNKNSSIDHTSTHLTQADVRRAFRDVNRSVHNYNNHDFNATNTNASSTTKVPVVTSSSTQAIHGTTRHTTTQPNSSSLTHSNNHSTDSMRSISSNHSHSSHHSGNSNDSNAKVAELFDFTHSNTSATVVNALCSTEPLPTQPVTQYSYNATQFTALAHSHTQVGASSAMNNSVLSLRSTQVYASTTAAKPNNIFTQMSQAGKKMTFDSLLDD